MSRTSAVAALVALLLLPAAARASSSFTVAQDVQNVPDSVWRAGTLGAQLNVSHEGNIVRVEATDGRRSARMNFGAPQGKPLAKGIYTDAHSAIGANADGRPGMDFEPSSCNFFSGDFEVKDIAFDAVGNPTRLWILYQWDCGYPGRGEWGEIRVGEPDSPVPSVLRWDQTDAGYQGVPHTVTFAAPAGGMKPGAASIEGDSQFVVTTDSCGGKTVAAGDTCAVDVRFLPTSAGTHEAKLHVPGAGDVPLQAFAHGGSTRLVATSDGGDFIGGGGGKSYSYGPQVVQIARAPTTDSVSEGLEFVVPDPNGTQWLGSLAAPNNAPLAVGRYTGAKERGNTVGAPTLDITAFARGCNTNDGEFTITDITRYPSSVLKTFGADFSQVCNGTGSLHGTIEFRKGDTAAPAPWMAGGVQPSSDPCSAPAFAAARSIVGTKRSNHIRGSRKSEVIRAGAGNDVIRAGGGNDCVDGGTGHDRIDCGAGKDVAIVGPGDRTRGCEVKVRVRR